MSVIKNLRTESTTEYENQFNILYGMISQKMIHISKRRKRWIVPGIMNVLNSAYEYMSDISGGYIVGKTKSETKKLYGRKTINELLKLKPLIYCYWNKENIETKKMRNWCNLLNKEIDLILQYTKDEMIYEKFVPLDKEKIQETKFLKNISQLDKKIFSSAMRLPNVYHNVYVERLIQAVDLCFYSLIEANNIFPNTKEEYDRRRQFFSNAISHLLNAKKAMRDIALHNLFTNDELSEFSDMMCQERKMVEAVVASDKKRFSKLK